MFRLTRGVVLRAFVPRRFFWPFTKPDQTMVDRISSWWPTKTQQQILRDQLVQTNQLRLLWDELRVQKAERFFDSIRPRSVDHWNLMIHGHAHLGNMREARLYFDELIIAADLYGIFVDERCYAPLLGAYSKRNDIMAIQALMSHMQGRGLSLGEACYASLLSAVANKADVVGAEALFAQMKQQNVKPNVLHFNALMKACANAGDLNRMEGYFNDMIEKWHIEPSGATFSIRILGYGKRSLPEAVAVFHSVNEYFVREGCFRSMLKVFAQYKAADEIDQFLDTMQSKYGVSPSVVIFNEILKPLCLQGQIELASRYFNQMRTLQIPPNVATFNYLISAYVNQARLGMAIDFDAVSQLFNNFRQNHLKPTEATARLMLQAFAFMGQYERVESYLEEMEKVKFVIDETTFELVLNAYAQVFARTSADKAKCKECIARTLVLMQETYKVPLSLKTHNIILRGLGEAGLTDDMMQHVALMRSCGVQLDIVSYNTIIAGFLGCKQLEKAFEHIQLLSTLNIQHNSKTELIVHRMWQAAINEDNLDPEQFRRHYMISLNCIHFLLTKTLGRHKLSASDVLQHLRLMWQFYQPPKAMLGMRTLFESIEANSQQTRLDKAAFLSFRQAVLNAYRFAIKHKWKIPLVQKSRDRKSVV